MGIFDSIGSLFGSDSVLGVQAWTSPDLVRVQDGVSSNAVLLLGVTSNYLKVTGFGFSIPMDATVTGVMLTVVRWSTVNLGTQDVSVRLYKGGTMQGDDKSAGAMWSTGTSTVTFGGQGDTWGLSLTPADCNDPGFGAGIAAKALILSTASVDWMNLTVYYTGSNLVSRSMGGSLRAGSGMSVSGLVN